MAIPNIYDLIFFLFVIFSVLSFYLELVLEQMLRHS